MKRTLVAALVAGSLSAPILALAAEDNQQSSRSEHMQQWAADRETMLDADKSRIDAMGQMKRIRSQGERMSPIDHLEAMADRLSQGATNIKKIADAAKPLYGVLDESQKHKFGMLGRMLMPERSRFAMDMMHHHMGEHDHDGAE
jgi:hypothetical protein